MNEHVDEKSWYARFERLDAAPWPGPRPIKEREGKEGRLLGRDREADDFVAAVLDHLLVVLTADSGVGKSSLLNGKLLPRLEVDGFLPVCVREWHFGEAEGPGAFLGRQVVAALEPLAGTEGAGKKLPDPASHDFWTQIDDLCGERLVLVLDQFEELIRFQSQLFRQTIEWLVKLNRDHHIRIVISLRAEFHHQLLELERQARPFTMTTYRLKPLKDPAEITKVINGFDDRIGGIGPWARKALTHLWTQAHAEADEPPGLLHLQGLLYALHHRKAELRPMASEGVSAKDNLVAVRDIRMLIKAAFEAAKPGEHPDVFAFGLQEAVRVKLQHCRTAAREVNMDRTLVDGTDAIVHRVVPHLSSGGFKLVLDEWTVAQRALVREMKLSPLEPSRIRELYKHAGGITKEAAHLDLATTWPEDVPLELGGSMMLGPREGPYEVLPSDEAPDSAAYVWQDWVSWGHDISTGPMYGMGPEAIMYQELRRFSFAMVWLEAASLVRRSVPKADLTMVALIHDGFGAALERGFGGAAESFTHVMARLTGALGEEFFAWPGAELEEFRPRPGASASPGYLAIVNTRWRDCTIREVEFAGVVFVNGDFRGTRFEGCTFAGATFVNCLLDNASFIDCIVQGAPELEMPAGEADVAALCVNGDQVLPDFRVEVPADEVALLVRYRRLAATKATHVYSRTSGIAAHPDDGRRERGIDWKPAAGGLAMFGGRLSSLMVRDGTFVDVPVSPVESAKPEESQRSYGTLALRHIAGASLDLVEHRSGRIEIVDSIMRGLTVTAPLDAKSVERWTGPGDRASVTTIDVVSAIMASTWFGSGLSGKAKFTDCVLTQLTNLSEKDQFSVKADQVRNETIAVGLVASIAKLRRRFGRITTKDGDRAKPPMWAFRVMDYRSQPAKLELDKRAQSQDPNGPMG